MRSSSQRFSAMVLTGAGLTLALAAPLLRQYAERLSSRRGLPEIVAIATGCAALLAGSGWMLHRHPRIAAAFLGSVAVLTLLLSRNLTASLEALAVLVLVFLLGDAVSRAIRGVDPDIDDWAATLAAGIAASGLVVLALAELGILRPGLLVATGVIAVVSGWRRTAAYGAQFGDRLSRSGQDPREPLDTLWMTLIVGAFAVTWAKVLGPDLSWDALAYHLPEARDVAEHGRVALLPDLFPQSLLWHNFENFLGLGFFFNEGERVTRFLHLAAGVVGIGATATLSSRVGAGASRRLVLLTLVGFPLILFQFYSGYVDWAAAALVAAAAAELAASRADPRRSWLGAFLFGAAVVTKPFAILAAPALVALYLRRRGWRPMPIAAAAIFALLPVAPWMVWSARHFGSPLAPLRYSDAGVTSLPGGRLARDPGPRPDSPSRSSPPRQVRPSVAGFLRVPYDITFHSSRIEGFRDGYFGALALVIGLGVLGWPPSRILLFAGSALAALIPWYLGPYPSVRYLLPVYPLYAVFTAVGLSRGANRFSGQLERAAGIALAAVFLAFPTQFVVHKWEIGTAFGLVSREEVLSSQLPSYSLWKLVSPRDRVVLIGEFDRFHCPADLVYRARFIPVVDWDDEPAVWRQQLRRYGITVVVMSSLPRLWPLPRRPRELASSGDLQFIASHDTTTLYRVKPLPP